MENTNNIDEIVKTTYNEIKDFVDKYVEKVNKGEPTNYFEDEIINTLYLFKEIREANKK